MIDLLPQKRTIFSPFRINMYNKCPRRYLFVDNNIPEPFMDKTALWLGTSVHKSIEDYYATISISPSIAEIKKVAEQCFSNNFNPRLSIVIKKTYNICKDTFFKFEKWRYSNKENPFRPQIVEKDLKSKKFHCIPDWYHGGRIIDFKTSKNPNLTCDHQIELWIQAEVLEANGYEVDSIQLFFLRYNKFVDLPKPNLGWLYEQRTTVLDAIRLKYFPPKVSILCHWCPFKLRCEYDLMNKKLPSDQPVDLWNSIDPGMDSIIIPQRITHIPEW